MWKDTSPAGGEKQLRRPGCGLRVVRATLQRLQPSLLGPERLGITRASALPRAGPSVAAGVGGSRGRRLKCDFPSLTSPKRSAWIHPGAIPEPSEAMGDSQSMILSLMASFKRSAGSHPGTNPEPSETVGESQSMFLSWRTSFT